MSKETKKQKQTSSIQPRPPIVVILGHVDHGKSSILEAIKDLKITEKESGGITQHIGAYEVEHSGKKITFVDTPGHEAFSAMRSRGAQVADIAILVVAAEEGIKPQTREAIEHIQKAEIPMIVAINKIDKPTADPEKVKRELLQLDVKVESMGGKIPCVETSATTKKGITDLLELILLIGEMENLEGDISKKARGVVIESYLDSQRGPVATLLLRDGILKQENVVATSSCIGKIKTLKNFQEKSLDNAMPSQPVIVLGFEKTPPVGEKFIVCANVGVANEYVAKAKREESSFAKDFSSAKAPASASSSAKATADKKAMEDKTTDTSEDTSEDKVENETPDETETPDKRILNLILKSDVKGSLEAIEQVLKSIPQDKVGLQVLKKEVGEVNENDINLAKASNAKVFAFRVKTNPSAIKLAEKEKINIMRFDIIYELSQAARQIMEKIIKPSILRDDLGKVKTLLIFKTEKNRQVVGGKIIDGEIKKGLKIDVMRDDEKIGNGKIISLQKNKKEIEKAGKREEVGILFDGDVKIEQGDTLLFYIEKKEKNTL